MNALTCHDVETQLDLFAAGECDRPTRRAIERHLEECAACAAGYAESQRLLGLLDLHWNAAALERLQEHIEREARPVPRLRLYSPFTRQALALAAMLLVTLGLAGMLPKTQDGRPDLEVAVLAQGPARPLEVRLPHEAMTMKAPVPEMVKVDVVRGQSGEEFRTALRQAKERGTLPPPAELPLTLRLRNAGMQPLDVRLGERSELTLPAAGSSTSTSPSRANTP
jgi:hypothetical protein